MHDGFDLGRPRRRRLWICLASLYGLWLVALTTIVMLPERREDVARGALVMTGLAELHHDASSHESVVLRQLRRP